MLLFNPAIWESLQNLHIYLLPIYHQFFYLLLLPKYFPSELSGLDQTLNTCNQNYYNIFQTHFTISTQNSLHFILCAVDIVFLLKNINCHINLLLKVFSSTPTDTRWFSLKHPEFCKIGILFIY